MTQRKQHFTMPIQCGLTLKIFNIKSRTLITIHMKTFITFFTLLILTACNAFCQRNTTVLHEPDSQALLRAKVAAAVLLTMYGQDSVIRYQDSINKAQQRINDSLAVTCKTLVAAVNASASLTKQAIKERDTAVTDCNTLLDKKDGWAKFTNAALWVLGSGLIIETAILIAR